VNLLILSPAVEGGIIDLELLYWVAVAAFARVFTGVPSMDVFFSDSSKLWNFLS
jgi:hypothetical protein